jgi:hypothetical protein
MLKDSLDESKFQMWRACVAAVYLDGKVTIEEADWVEQKIEDVF